MFAGLLLNQILVDQSLEERRKTVDLKVAGAHQNGGRKVVVGEAREVIEIGL